MLYLVYMSPLSTSILKLLYLSITSPPSSMFVTGLSLTSRRSKGCLCFVEFICLEVTLILVFL